MIPVLVFHTTRTSNGPRAAPQPVITHTIARRLPVLGGLIRAGRAVRSQKIEPEKVQQGSVCKHGAYRSCGTA
jgi:hypothetical protein